MAWLVQRLTRSWANTQIVSRYKVYSHYHIVTSTYVDSLCLIGVHNPSLPGVHSISDICVCVFICTRVVDVCVCGRVTFIVLSGHIIEASMRQPQTRNSMLMKCYQMIVKLLLPIVRHSAQTANKTLSA